MNRINLALVEKKLGGMLPQAKDPRDPKIKVPHTGGDGGNPKAQKAKSMKGQPDFKDPTKFARKPTGSKVSSPKGGRPEKAPKSGSLAPKQKFSPAKKAAQPDMRAKGGFSGAVPDAVSVKKRGLMGNDAGSAAAHVVSKVLGSVKEPSKDHKRIEVGSAKIVKPDLGFGLLKPGSQLDALGNLKMNMDRKGPGKALPGKPINEGRVFAGRVTISVAGKTRFVMEAATPEMIVAAASDFTRIGAKAVVDVKFRGRRIYSDPAFATKMLECAHAKHLKLGDAARKAALEATKIASEILAEERDERVHATKSAWVSQCIRPLVRQAIREFDAAYAGLVESREVVVHTDAGRRKYTVRTADERHAAVAGFDMALAEDIGSAPKRAYVGARRFLPESATAMRWPEPFDELTTAVFTGKYKDGRAAEVSPKRAPEMKIGSAASKAPKLGFSERGGNKESLVDRDGSRTNRMGPALKSPAVSKDKGPVFESRRRRKVFEDAQSRVMSVLRATAAASKGDERRKAVDLMRQVQSNAELTGAQAKALNTVIEVALERKS